MYMCVCVCGWVCVHQCRYSQKPETSDPPGVDVTGDYELPDNDCWELNLSPLREQCVVLTTGLTFPALLIFS